MSSTRLPRRAYGGRARDCRSRRPGRDRHRCFGRARRDPPAQPRREQRVGRRLHRHRGRHAHRHAHRAQRGVGRRGEEPHPLLLDPRCEGQPARPGAQRHQPAHLAHRHPAVRYRRNRAAAPAGDLEARTDEGDRPGRHRRRQVHGARLRRRRRRRARERRRRQLPGCRPGPGQARARLGRPAAGRVRRQLHLVRPVLGADVPALLLLRDRPGQEAQPERGGGERREVPHREGGQDRIEQGRARGGHPGCRAAAGRRRTGQRVSGARARRRAARARSRAEDRHSSRQRCRDRGDGRPAQRGVGAARRSRRARRAPAGHGRLAPGDRGRRTRQRARPHRPTRRSRGLVLRRSSGRAVAEGGRCRAGERRGLQEPVRQGPRVRDLRAGAGPTTARTRSSTRSTRRGRPNPGST